MASYKLIRLNQWTVRVSPEIQILMDLPIFQRLRNISQVELVHLAYPGATQNRYQHSLGVYHLAEKYTSSLLQKYPGLSSSILDPLTILGFHISALYHDIAHCAYSHSFDRTVAHHVYPESSKPHDVKRHEVLRNILTTDGPISDGPKLMAIVEAIWDKKHFLSPLLNGPISIDRMDYISRDIFYSGKSSMGFPPIERIIQYSYLQEIETSDYPSVIDTDKEKEKDKGEEYKKENKKENKKEWVICYDNRLLHEIEQFLRMRQTMYTTVYYHHKSVAGSIVVDRMMNWISNSSHLSKSTSTIFPNSLIELYHNHLHLIVDDYINNWVLFDPRLSMIRNHVLAITTQRSWLPKYIDQITESHTDDPLDTQKKIVELQSLCPSGYIWISPWLDGLQYEHFEHIRFKDSKSGILYHADQAFEKYKITPTVRWRVYKLYNIPPILSLF